MDALEGAPGLYSARYGSTDGNKLSDADRRKYLISQLGDNPRPWTAHFTATIAVAVPKLWSPTDLLSEVPEQAPALQMFEGFCPGEIIPEERGTGGFGYDPIFLLTDRGQTMAELSMDEKNRLSHRARAVIKAKEVLKSLLDSS